MVRLTFNSITHTVHRILTPIAIMLAALAVVTMGGCTQEHIVDRTDNAPLSRQMHIAAIIVDGMKLTAQEAKSGQTRSSLEDGTSTSGEHSALGTAEIKPNTAITGLKAGDELRMDYTFGGVDNYAALLTLGDDGKSWIISKYSDSEAFATAPNQGGDKSESWEGFLVNSVEYLTLSSNPGSNSAQDPSRSADALTTIYGISSNLAPSADKVGTLITEGENAGELYTIHAETDPTSTQLGGLTIALVHKNVMLRIAEEDLHIGAWAEGYNNLSALMVKATDGNVDHYYAFDKVNIGSGAKAKTYWQCIIQRDLTIKELIPTIAISSETGASASEMQLAPIAINGSTGIVMKQNYRYPIALTLNPIHQATAITLPALPGWGYGTHDNNQVSDPFDIAFNDNGTPGVAQDDVYEIQTAQGLRAFAALVNGDAEPADLFAIGVGFAAFGTSHPDINGKLLENIDLSSVCGATVGTGNTPLSWIPIGDRSRDDKLMYRGTFDGDGKTVSNLYINDNKDYQALFGCLNGSTIKNLGITNGSSVTGKDYVGGVAGCANSSTLTACYNTASVTGGENSRIGGLVGCVTESSTLTACYNTASVTGAANANVGGVVGYMTGSSTLTACYNTASVTGSEDARVGGVAGNVINSTLNTNYFVNTDETAKGVGSEYNNTGNALNSSSFAQRLADTASLNEKVGAYDSSTDESFLNGCLYKKAGSIGYTYQAGTNTASDVPILVLINS